MEGSDRVGRCPQREPGLTHSAGPGHRDQRVAGHELVEFGQFGATTNETGQLEWNVAQRAAVPERRDRVPRRLVELVPALKCQLFDGKAVPFLELSELLTQRQCGQTALWVAGHGLFDDGGNIT